MDLEHKAIERLKEASEISLAYYEEPLLITVSGGKDSAALLELARRAGIPYEARHSLTTADAPQTVWHVKETFRRLELEGVKCGISYPTYQGKRTSMWRLIEEKGIPPTRRIRYCCKVLKEQAGKGRTIATGVRWDESGARSGRGELESTEANPTKRVIVGGVQENPEQMAFSDSSGNISTSGEIMLNNDNDKRRRLIEHCQMKGETICNPIIDWTTWDVFSLLRDAKVKLNPLYECGFTRVGCIGCPMAGAGRRSQFEMFPKYRDMYIRAFDRMLERRKQEGKATKQKTGYDVFLWLMEDKNIEEQVKWDDLEADMMPES